jgi:hypothetical protein
MLYARYVDEILQPETFRKYVVYTELNTVHRNLELKETNERRGGGNLLDVTVVRNPDYFRNIGNIYMDATKIVKKVKWLGG